MITASGLDRILIIERESTVQDAYGTPTSTWTTVATVRAQRVDMSAKDFLRADGEGSEALAVFRIRWRPDLTVEDRVTTDGRTFDIIGIIELGRRRTLELRCRERT